MKKKQINIIISGTHYVDRARRDLLHKIMDVVARKFHIKEKGNLTRKHLFFLSSRTTFQSCIND